VFCILFCFGFELENLSGRQLAAANVSMSLQLYQNRHVCFSVDTNA